MRPESRAVYILRILSGHNSGDPEKEISDEYYEQLTIEIEKLQEYLFDVGFHPEIDRYKYD